VTKHPVELWTIRLLLPGQASRWARQAEGEGWDGIAVGDSQSLAADAFVQLGILAADTTRLGLGTAVTNPVTRHPAVVASAIAAIQGESGGRANLGVGRGDSALAHLGLAPAPVPVFERFVRRVQGYLRGDEVHFDPAADGGGLVPTSASLGLSDAPRSSRLQWLPQPIDKVPLDVFASGPRVISFGAVTADRVTFAVGSDPARVKWAIDLARAARRTAGLDPLSLPLGVSLPLVVQPSLDRARELAAGGVASFARFSVMHGTVHGPVDEPQRQTLEAVRAAYDMSKHYSDGSKQSTVVTDELIEAFGIAGPPSLCVERIQELHELGIGRFTFQLSVAGADADEMRTSRRLIAEKVIPALR
jgi:5,10-methylenetetrahydromethanopterin reductase